MKYCNNCGAELKPGQRVCTQCGTPVQQTSTHPTPPKKSKLPIYIIIVAVIVIIIALFTVYKIIYAQLSPTKPAQAISKHLKAQDTDSLVNHSPSNGATDHNA